ncbi:MAG: DUF1501 domain-containing protein [Verrucomicrobiales bacterium]
MSRRALLRVGALGLGGLALPQLLAARERASISGGGDPLRGRSVIFLFQQGGPSQHETFDPKVGAPEGVRTIGGTVATKIPGVHFGASMAQLAGLADRFSVVRSFYTGNGGHNIQPVVGADSLEANIGAHYARIAGATAPSGMPANMVLFPQAADKRAPKPEARGDLASTGPYGSAYAPFIPGGGGSCRRTCRSPCRTTGSSATGAPCWANSMPSTARRMPLARSARWMPSSSKPTDCSSAAASPRR